MTTQESNKLIAEFMQDYIHIDDVGMYFYEQDKINHEGVPTGAFYPEEMCYNTSWDWLMPCIERISMDYEGLPELFFGHLSLDSPIEMVYEAVVEFLKQQNG